MDTIMRQFLVNFGILLWFLITMVTVSGLPQQQYSMYVWTTGFDPSIPGCDQNKFLAWDKSCFNHVWDTADERQWLWNTCKVSGREITAIYLSDMHHNLRDAYRAGDCNTDDIRWVRETIAEGHSQVPGLKIYALYAVSDLAVSEKDLVPYVVYYNDHCAVDQHERLDGVAVNNEAYGPIKCGDMAPRLQYLNDLHQIAVEAGKQSNGKLLTHYSVGWHWGRCDSTQSMMTWNRKTSDATHHMIDIFDSVDVQVGYIKGPQMADRVRTAGYDYALSQGKDIYVTVYTNEGPICVSTFFPDKSCDATTHSEANMLSQFDSFADNGVSSARPCIHYFRGSYSSGGTPAWPKHDKAAERRQCRRFRK